MVTLRKLTPEQRAERERNLADLQNDDEATRRAESHLRATPSRPSFQARNGKP